MTRWEKNCQRASQWEWVFISFKLWPLVALWLLSWKKVDHGVVEKHLSSLNYSLRSALFHLSAEHFLLRCPEHHAARSVMIDDIDMILFTSKCKSVPTLSEHFLLAPNWDSNLSKKEDVAIKVTLFKFLSSVQRKLWCSIVIAVR